MRTLALAAALASLPTFAAPDVALEVRSQRVLDLPGIARLSVEDGSIVEVRALNSGQIWLVGIAVGETTVGVWHSNGELTTFKVRVDAASPRALRLGGELLLEDDFDQIETTSMNVEVRMLSRGVAVVRAKAGGKATVVLSLRGVAVRDIPVIVR